MKTSIKNRFILTALMAGLALISPGRVTAQTFTTLHNFLAIASDGGNPFAGVILSSNTLYGTTRFGGSSGVGTIFKVNTNGAGFTNLHSFVSASDGAQPYAKLILAGNRLYGTAYLGGISSKGSLFAVNIDGTGFTNLHSFTATSVSSPFTNGDGALPFAGLVLSGNTLYGAAEAGGSFGKGTVFAINTNGAGFTNLHSFAGNPIDGANPEGDLIVSGNTLYGTTSSGGSSGRGTVFAVKTDGTGFTNLYSFTSPTASTNSDGYNPYAALLLTGNTLYGTATVGGSSGNGTIFAINTNGTAFTNLHSFSALNSLTNNDGANPVCVLSLSGNTLYGTASVGGSLGKGTVFALNTNGTSFTILHSFMATSGVSSTNSDGTLPSSGLILSDNTLYGTAARGGTSGAGTVFSLTLPPPQLTIIRSGANVILTWPTNPAGFTLQSAPAISGTFTNIIPAATSPFTNSITGTQQFYRLSQ